jgi:hypothetical protein
VFFVKSFGLPTHPKDTKRRILFKIFKIFRESITRHLVFDEPARCARRDKVDRFFSQKNRGKGGPWSTFFPFPEFFCAKKLNIPKHESPKTVVLERKTLLN